VLQPCSPAALLACLLSRLTFLRPRGSVLIFEGPTRDMKTFAGALLSLLMTLLGAATGFAAQPWDFDFRPPPWSWGDFGAFVIIVAPLAFVFSGLTAFALPFRWWLGAAAYSAPAAVGLFGALRAGYWSGSAGILVCICSALAAAVLSERRNRAFENESM
jgi:hypothetical protein